MGHDKSYNTNDNIFLLLITHPTYMSMYVY